MMSNILADTATAENDKQKRINVDLLTELQSGEKFRVTATVTNTGNCDGKEVAQCYVNDLLASMTRPVKELKGFSKVLLKQGEHKEVSFELGLDELGFYNAAGKFCVEPGEFSVFVGGDCTTANSVRIEVVTEQ